MHDEARECGELVRWGALALLLLAGSRRGDGRSRRRRRRG